MYASLYVQASHFTSSCLTISLISGGMILLFISLQCEWVWCVRGSDRSQILKMGHLLVARDGAIHNNGKGLAPLMRDKKLKAKELSPLCDTTSKPNDDGVI